MARVYAHREESRIIATTFVNKSANSDSTAKPPFSIYAHYYTGS